MKEKPLILAVDDDENFLEIITVQLQSVGFETVVLATADLVKVVRHCERLMPDLVLLDIYLSTEPVGIHIAAALRQNEKTRHIKVIMWSSVRDEWRDHLSQNASLANLFSPEDFFDKAEDLQVLTAKIKRLLVASPTAS